MVSTGHVGGICGSSIVSSASDMLWMSVVRGMRGVGRVCEICMCLTRVGVGGEGDERIGFGLYQSCGNRGSVGRVSVFWLLWCGWGVGEGRGPGSGGVAWCYVSVRCESGLSV